MKIRTAIITTGLGLNSVLFRSQCSTQTEKRHRINLEVCVGDVESVIAAKSSGAQRVELCDSLDVGGTTPSIGAIEAAAQAITGSCCRLHVLIRPRPGDFCFSDTEVQVMLRDIEAAKKAGAHGVVIGALKPNRTIDCDCTRDLVNAARPMTVTFHRAFDWCHEPHEAMEELNELGVDFILTSGQASSAWEGRALLRALNQRKERPNGPRLIAGAGVSLRNVADLVEVTGVSDVHAGSALQCDLISPMWSHQMEQEGVVSMGKASASCDFVIRRTDPEKVTAMRRRLDIAERIMR